MSKINNSCSIYLKLGKKKMKIPVNPEEIEVKYPSDHKEYDVLGVGQIVIPRKPALKEVAWESFFPGSMADPYINRGADEPGDYVKAIEKAMKAKQMVRVIISRSKLYDMNMRCLISNFETTDRGGEPGDMYYSIEFQEYRDYSPRTVSVVTTPVADSGGQAEASTEQERPVETPVLRVGAQVIASGSYWNDSYGANPSGKANNLSTTVTRIVEGNPYPVHIGSQGWLKADQLQITG